MINGAHVVLSSSDADADRAFLRDVLGLPYIDAGDGWLIFGLPPAEVAVHPADTLGRHELYLMCDDIEALVTKLDAVGVSCAPRHDEGWGIVSGIPLPGGSRLGVYEPRHARPPSPPVEPSDSPCH